MGWTSGFPEIKETRRADVFDMKYRCVYCNISGSRITIPP